MVADASIYSQIRAPQQMDGPLDQFTKTLQLKNMLDDQALRGMQREQIQGQLGEERAYRTAAMESGGDMMKLKNLLYQRGAPTKAMALEKTILENKKAQGEIGKTDSETYKIRAENTRDATAKLTGPQDLPAYIETLKVIWGPDMVAKMPIVTNPPDFSQPGAFEQWKLGQAMQSKDVIDRLSPKLEKVDRGGQIDLIDPYTGKPKGASMTKSMTPGEIAANERSKEKNAIDAVTTPFEATGPDGKPILAQMNKRTGVIVDANSKQQVGVTPKTSDTEKKAGGYADRMKSAAGIMSELERGGVGKPEIDETLVGSIPLVSKTELGKAATNTARSDDRQKYRQAQEDWVRAKLRQESGAVIADEEMDREIRTYFPQLGDSQAVLEQKSIARKTAEEAMHDASGRPALKEAPKVSRSDIDAELRRRGVIK